MLAFIPWAEKVLSSCIDGIASYLKTRLLFWALKETFWLTSRPRNYSRTCSEGKKAGHVVAALALPLLFKMPMEDFRGGL
jgi:hypothetical protein